MACKEGEDNLTGEKNKNHRQRKIAYVLCCSLLVGAAVVCLKKWVFPRLGDTGETNTRITQIWSAEDYLAFVESLLDHARREGGQVQSQNGGKFSCELWRLRYDGLPGDWLAAMPQTFMNLSGQCVQPLLAWHKIRPDQLVVVHDELDIPAGELHFKKGGGNAGHNGLKSITQLLGTPDFYRLRIGIGRPPQKGDVINWVLGRPCSEDADKIRTATDKALEVLEIFAKKGLEAAVRATRS